jgi:hypothetical protein
MAKHEFVFTFESPPNDNMERFYIYETAKQFHDLIDWAIDNGLIITHNYTRIPTPPENS